MGAVLVLVESQEDRDNKPCTLVTDIMPPRAILSKLIDIMMVTLKKCADNMAAL